MSWLHGVATRLRLMLSSLGAISLDLKLGIRMLAKYPGLAFVGVLGISVAVVIGALAFTAAALFDSSALPLDEGERVVAIQNFDLRRDTREFAPHVHDLAIFRETLRAVEDIAGYRVVGRNLITADAGPGAVSVAEVNASVFRLARVSPMRGRYLTDDDEREAAPPVAVIAYDTWQQRLGGRADVIGTTVQIGALRHTVVGVMPSGFAFPVNNQLWVPLRLDRSPYEHGDGPTINVVARLAPGASHADVHAQLATLGQRLGVEYPNAHEHIRPRALPYHRVLVDLHPQVFHLARVVVALLLVVIATNVAVLVYARTASRAGEMAVRTALGASRRRIVMQLFSEALVLSGAAAVVGMAITHFIFERINTLVEQYAGDQFPNWMRLDLTTGVVVRISALAIVSAVIIGVLPALKATRYRLFENLKHLSGNSSMRLGRTWTALLVAQVAVSVAALPIALSGGAHWANLIGHHPGNAATRSFLIATALMDPPCCGAEANADQSARRSRYARHVAALVEQLEAEPGGFDVVLMGAAPGADRSQEIEVDRITPAQASDTLTTPSHGSAAVGNVDAEFFDALAVRVLSGRNFAAADFATGAPAVIVNRSFVQRFVGSGSALGRRVRRAAGGSGERSASWWEIVGVVDDFPAMPASSRPRVYLPLRPADVYPMTLAVRARSLTPATVAERVRMVAISVDPALAFRSIRGLDDMLDDEIEMERLGMFGLVMVAVSVVLLSAAGIYALMSFTVERRRREIGIRAALGARSGRVVTQVLSRAMRQIGIGIAIGAPGAAVLAHVAGDSTPLSELPLWLLKVGGLTALVGAIATIGPARRALRVQPTEALRAE